MAKNDQAEGFDMAADDKTMDSARREDPEELVEYAAPLMPGRTDRDIFVAVNGESIRIKRGATVRIKRKFLEVLQHAEEQEMAAYRYMMKAQQLGEAIAQL